MPRPQLAWGCRKSAYAVQTFHAFTPYCTHDACSRTIMHANILPMCPHACAFTTKIESSHTRSYEVLSRSSGRKGALCSSLWFAVASYASLASFSVITCLRTRRLYTRSIHLTSQTSLRIDRRSGNNVQWAMPRDSEMSSIHRKPYVFAKTTPYTPINLHIHSIECLAPSHAAAAWRSALRATDHEKWQAEQSTTPTAPRYMRSGNEAEREEKQAEGGWEKAKIHEKRRKSEIRHL